MRPTLRNMLLAGGLLFAFALIGSTVLSLTYEGTRNRVAENQRRALVQSLNQLVPPNRYDNSLLTDVIRLRAPEFGTEQLVTIYRARHGGRPVAVLAEVIAQSGYAGPIKLLVAVNADGRLAGVRVTQHRETPGLGDGIEIERSDWILSFADRGLGDPPSARWAVKKDGGDFDQFTGATITPRAVVKAIHNFLIYFERNRDRLFSGATAGAKGQTE